MNSVVLAGRLVADPELKTTQTGVEVTSFRLAVNQDYAKQGEERKADFFNIVAWRQTAAFVCKYFHKGDGIVLKGKLQSRAYQANDGSNRYVVEVVADNVEFPLGKNNNENNHAAAYQMISTVPTATTTVPATTEQGTLPIDDDLPF